MEGYKWFGNIRKHLHRKAVRGSGGVGVLIREEVLKHYQVEILETEKEDMLWVKLNQREEEEGLVLALCYVSPESSSHGRSSEEYFQILAEQVAKFGMFGSLSPLIICGDFTARCGDFDRNSEGLPVWNIIDVVKNSQGEAFVGFLRANMMVVNGGKGRDTFACVSGRGCAVVDYCIVGKEDFGMIEGFEVMTMSEVVEEMRCEGVATRVPDALGGGCVRLGGGGER